MPRTPLAKLWAANRPESSKVTQFVGIDLSLTSTGLAVYWPDGVEAPDTLTVKTKPPLPIKDPYLAKLERFHNIADQIMDQVAPAEDIRVYLEGPSYGSAGRATHDIAGNWWTLYGRLVHLGCTVTVVPPSVVKMYATGKGNASKDAVLAAAIKRYPDVDIPGNDIADAVILLAIGCRLAGRPLEAQLPATHLRALEKLGKS